MGLLAELAAPVRCVACRASCGADLCIDCAELLEPLRPPWCDRCGAPTREAEDCCRGCSDLRGIDRARSLVSFGGRDAPARSLVLSLKRHGRRGLARDLGVLLASCAGTWGIARGQVAFVPAGARARSKGFDHARMLAREVAVALGVPLIDAVSRIGSAPRQADVPASMRRANAARSFGCRGQVAGEVLLVDDVMTTGATAEACALALKAAGAVRVDVLTVARALRRG